MNPALAARYKSIVCSASRANGYLQQVRSSRRLEAECRRNVEVMRLGGRNLAAALQS